MAKNKWNWQHLGITQKFILVFLLLLTLVVCIALTGYSSSLLIGKAVKNVRTSTAIGQLVLEMDRGMEKARRLHNGFFLQYQNIGLQEAHEQYAQPSVREIAHVISLSSNLKDLLSQSGDTTSLIIDHVDVNLYLASAKRFADTSIAAIELITQRAAPERGLEAQLTEVCIAMKEAVLPSTVLRNFQEETCSYFKDYQINRRRFLMQSSFNSLNGLRQAVGLESSLPIADKQSLYVMLDKYHHLADMLLEVDLAITGQLRDFHLQAKAVAPVSKKLVNQAQAEVLEAEQSIYRALSINDIIMLSITLFALSMVLFIAMVMHRSVTKKILVLSEAAGALSNGRLDVRVRAVSNDELGQLASLFNSMASNLQDLVENLETKVSQRTEELAISEERFRKLVNNLPKVAVQGYDSDRKVLYWNHASEMLFGYTADEAMGRMIDELIIPQNSQSKMIEAISQLYENDVPFPPAEIVLRHKDGGDVPVYSACIMQASSLGHKTMYCVEIDLADLKQAQKRVQRSESLYRELFDHSSSGVAVYEAIDDGADFVFKDFNKSGEEIEHINKRELIGKRVTEVFPEVKNFGLFDVLHNVWRTGEPLSHPITFYSDGRIEGWRENKVYKLPSGEIVAVFDDITAQKQAETEKNTLEVRLHRAQKMEAIGLMAGGIAHDLNNILSATVGYPELLLLRLPKDSDLTKPLKAIKDAGERAAAIVADLLTVARGVAGTREAVNINTLVNEYLDSPEFEAVKNAYPHIQFELQLKGTMPNIACSPVHVKKCIMNLVSNGAESLEQSGTVTLSTHIHEVDEEWAVEHGLQPNEYAVITVSDTGIGIPEKDIEHIFEPFYTKKMMTNKSGSGLGLSVVWNTMQDHDGAVLVTSSGKGTSFALYFPISDGKVSGKSKQNHATFLRGKGEVILVIDDDPLQCTLAQDMLEYQGYTVACSQSGEDAINYLQENKVDLVLLDMLMGPGMNGRQTYERICEIRPGQKAVIASGFSESEDVKAALRMGAGEFIKKPYSMQVLARAVKKGLEK